MKDLGRFHKLIALIIALDLLLGFYLSASSSFKYLLPYADTMRAAAMRMQNCLDIIKNHCKENNIAFEEEDLNSTGLIGPEWTNLTTSLGIVEAKRTALQPDWAALITKYYIEAGLEKADKVFAGFSGSFPGLCIASICAANELDLDIKIIPSIGSSMYGSTREELNILKILEILKENNAINFEILAVSSGGDFDRGEGNILFPNSKEVLNSIAKNSGYPYIYTENLSDSIKKRLNIFGSNSKCFVNVGGASTNMGVGSYGVAFPNGLVESVDFIPSGEERGLIFEYLVRGKKIIHLLNIKDLAIKSGLPIDPVPLTAVGDTDVYYSLAVNKLPAIISLIIAFIFIMAVIVINYKFRKKALDELVCK
ncbi:MAG: poly-gamma-glutamate system protein [Eubacteriales bacterium]|nr:poly-gamma-glutamate system protein [Eubacteriales bacterium]